MKKNFIIISCLVFSCFMQAQEDQDSLKTRGIQEVIVIKTQNISIKENKPLGSIDDYLQKSAQVDMIRRGAYAWEPTVNNMSTERTLVTIDGMRIFGACTDKMDPITSYVEVSNLASAKITSGQQGSCHGATIGGAIDLQRSKTAFGSENLKINLNSGFESVNSQKILGAGLIFKNPKLYNDTSFMFREAGNYHAGNSTEILYSQFKKINFSETLGYKINDKHLVESSLIYDKASNIGYPALPMDVSLAEAIITSLKHRYENPEGKIKSWETKFYYNNITHRMDDSKRPIVPIRMDMPGWSSTYGYYSKAQFDINKHQFLVNLSGYTNNSLAEMTMYPNNSTEKLMFMLTWPGVKTLNQGLFIEDHYTLNENNSLKASFGINYHHNKIEKEMGLQSLQIFYPELKVDKSRILKNFAFNYIVKTGDFEAGIGTGYGERSASVSEGYGFYLFNSSEKYDYIGNPNLKNENAWEGNSYISWKKNKNITLKLNASIFYIQNFMVGEVIPGFAPMTIGALGVKKMSALDHANIINLGLNTEIKITPQLQWKTQISYNYGKDHRGELLPYISPIRYRSSLAFDKNALHTEISLIGNTSKKHYNTNYGESSTPDFAILNATIGYSINFGRNKIMVKTGVENIFDTYYTTFSDWNKIPRPGRNFFININYAL